MAEIKNKIVREAQEQYHLFGYQVARLLSISESTFGRMMREELPIQEQERIVKLIREACNEGK